MTTSARESAEAFLEGVDTRVWDVIVAGAGPAGSTAAYHLASAGHTVLLVDRHEFPREKVCGDALIPDALNSLRTLGLYNAVRALGHCVNRLTAFSPSRLPVRVDAECITLRRELLDALIAEKAIAQGTTFRVGAVASIRQKIGGGVTVTFHGSERRAQARVAILATGANVSLLENLGVVQRPTPSGLALRCYVRSAHIIDDLIISFDRSITPGYAWIFPMGNREYNVGCGVFYNGTRKNKINLREAFSAFMTHFPVARSLMSKAESATPLRGAMLRSGLEGAARSCNGGSIVSIGETIGATYPFTGEGIGKAMETAALAARQIDYALQRDDPEPIGRIPRLIEEQLASRYVGYQVAQRWLSRPWLYDLVAIRIRSSRRLQDAAAGILNETTDPGAVFCWRTLLPTWARRLMRA